MPDLMFEGHTGDDGMWASVPSEPGVFATGSTFEDLVESLVEAVGFALEVDIDGYAVFSTDDVQLPDWTARLSFGDDALLAVSDGPRRGFCPHHRWARFP